MWSLSSGDPARRMALCPSTGNQRCRSKKKTDASNMSFHSLLTSSAAFTSALFHQRQERGYGLRHHHSLAIETFPDANLPAGISGRPLRQAQDCLFGRPGSREGWTFARAASGRQKRRSPTPPAAGIDAGRDEVTPRRRPCEKRRTVVRVFAPAGDSSAAGRSGPRARRRRCASGQSPGRYRHWTNAPVAV